MNPAELAARMQALELQLLHADHSGDPALAERLLAGDFCEVHGAGGVASRAEVLAWLRGKDPKARWALSEFTAQELSPTVSLVTYHARQVAPQASRSQGARHVSLWRQTPGGRDWQLCFHQATRVA